MRRILITGATGFIGSTFLKLYKEHFEDVLIARRGASAEEIDNLTQNSDAIVHLAYDRLHLKENFRLLNRLIKSAKKNRLKRFIFMSTFSVYDPFLQGRLNENSPYSPLNDHYSFVKIGLEKRLEKFSKDNDAPEIVILQPGIVYGRNGNWFLHAIKSLSTGLIRLPLAGRGYCNAVSVEDVCHAIYLALSKQNYVPPQGIIKLLISEETPVTWYNFYKAHMAYLSQKNVDFESADDSVMFSPKFVKELLYRLLFNQIGVRIVMQSLEILFRFKKIKHEKTIQEALESGNKTKFFEPEGINRVVHSCQFTIDVSKAKVALGFTPSRFADYDFLEAK